MQSTPPRPAPINAGANVRCTDKVERTGLLYYALGNILRLQTRYDEAYEVQKSCLAMFEKTCGEGNHLIADAYYKVAWHRQNRARSREEYENAM